MRHFILGCLMIAFSSVGATTFEMPPAGEDIIGHSFSIKARGGDTLASVGEDFGIGFHEMEEANPKSEIFGITENLLPSPASL